VRPLSPDEEASLQSLLLWSKLSFKGKGIASMSNKWISLTLGEDVVIDEHTNIAIAKRSAQTILYPPPLALHPWL
jgi:hypothetical protein